MLRYRAAVELQAADSSNAATKLGTKHNTQAAYHIVVLKRVAAKVTKRKDVHQTITIEKHLLRTDRHTKRAMPLLEETVHSWKLCYFHEVSRNVQRAC